MALFDTHAHLADPPLADRLPEVLRRAREAGVRAILCPAVHEENARAVRALPDPEGVRLYRAAGVHPWEVRSGDPMDLEWLRQEVLRGGVAAIGEVGMDGRIPGADLEAQQRVFREQAALAREAGLPLLVHVRSAWEPVDRVIREMGPGGPGGILHACGAPWEALQPLARLGFLRGVGGGVTRPEAVRLRRAVAETPLDCLVLETDAPYIGTHRTPRGQVQPGDLPEVRDALAALLGRSPREIEEATWEQAIRLVERGAMGDG
ncbi:MAG TPA: TatD family hydrolase [Myxococcota bacterium]|nr:TatD family hydrolase [Myxococcota bacterium]HQK49733.1 TatD family hydrolase [Myxococcota bacterium]